MDRLSVISSARKLVTHGAKRDNAKILMLTEGTARIVLNNWGFLIYFHWIRWIQRQKNICHYNKRAWTCHSVTSCVRDQDATTTLTRHMWETGFLNWAQFMLQLFFGFHEFADFSKFLFHLGKTPISLFINYASLLTTHKFDQASISFEINRKYNDNIREPKIFLGCLQLKPTLSAISKVIHIHTHWKFMLRAGNYCGKVVQCGFTHLLWNRRSAPAHRCLCRSRLWFALLV